ncbi:MAG: lysophospholipid acyltransferase family protein [Alphaproteobacteria bacterium]
MINIIRSLAFNFCYYCCLAIASVTFIILYIMPPYFTIKATYFCCKIILFCMRKVAGIDLEIRGVENIPQTGAIIASKHQSAMETFFFHTILKRCVYVLKRELLMVPLFGWSLAKSGCIGIDRKAGGKAMKKMLNGCKKALGKNNQVIIFPEGTRRMPDASPDYQPGIALIYSACNVPVVPVALNSGLFWPKRSFIKKKGKIIIEFLKPIDVGMDKRNFMKKLEEEIETNSNKLRKETEQFL